MQAVWRMKTMKAQSFIRGCPQAFGFGHRVETAPSCRSRGRPTEASACFAAPRFVFSAGLEEEEDLLQFPDRAKWYEAKWAALDQPDWNPAVFLRSYDITPMYRCIVLEVEISREKVPIMNAYKRTGQKAWMRIKNGLEFCATVCSPPFPVDQNDDALLKLRGDLCAGETKTEVEELSIKAELSLMVSEEESPELYNLEEDTPVEVGPFSDGGLKLRGPIFGIYRFPTVVIFCEGSGIAAARAMITATPDIVGLSMELRGDVKLYYKAANDSSFAFSEEFEDWRKRGCEVVTTTGSFQDAFDDDDTLVYEPAETAAVILTGGDEDSEQEALEVCKEAEISEVVRQSDPQDDTVYLQSGLNQI